jgi:monoamine oxidase
VVLSAAVQAIEHNSGDVCVVSTVGTVNARAVVIAVPPQYRAEISFTPALPAEAHRLANSWPQGNLSKAFAAYEKPFWRAAGQSGEALSDTGPVFITFDVGPVGDSPGVLLGFVDARAFDHLRPHQRREKVLEGFAALFGEPARQPIDYVDFSWGNESFSAGGPTAAVPPGSWTSVGRWLRDPIGSLFWAGTETADEWTGFLDGAVRSGLRAAAEVTVALG